MAVPLLVSLPVGLSFKIACFLRSHDEGRGPGGGGGRGGGERPAAAAEAPAGRPTDWQGPHGSLNTELLNPPPSGIRVRQKRNLPWTLEGSQKWQRERSFAIAVRHDRVNRRKESSGAAAGRQPAIQA